MSKNKTKTSRALQGMTEGARNLLVSLRNGGEVPGAGSVIEDNTPLVVTERTGKHYNRKNRRNHAFVLQNVSNGLFMKRVVNMSTGVISRKDVTLEEATLFRFDSLVTVINEVPGLNFEYFMVKRNDEKELILI